MDKINLDPLILYDNVRQDEIIQITAKIFNEFLYREYITYMEADYFKVQKLLLGAAEIQDVKGNYWQNYICRLVAESENRFSLLGERGEQDENIRILAIREINEIKKLYQLDWGKVSEVFQDVETSVSNMNFSHTQLKAELKRDRIRIALEADSNEETVNLMYEYYKSSGCGIFESNEAFLWDQCLIGVKNYDKITFEQLIGYENQKQALIENTEYFLQGYRANNVLLYGDRGTGKSSCIKALLNKFTNHKLKIISINKNQINHLNKITEMLSKRGCKFIIFIDDLSFEDTELEYKDFKSVLEGGIEVQPVNTLIYVTSNRRNLIKETWKDRGEETGEIHQNDGMQERLSLADRFGLTITFSSPDKSDYLEIIEGIAKQESITMNKELLFDEALKWELRHSGRSGRTARQFINYIKAKNYKNREEI